MEPGMLLKCHSIVTKPIEWLNSKSFPAKENKWEQKRAKGARALRMGT